MKQSPWFLVSIPVFLMVFGQIMSKMGSAQDNLFNYFVVMGYAALILRGVVWVLALRKLPLSFAYPVLSISFILVFVSSYVLFDETFTVNKVFGSILIITGVILISLRKAKGERI